MHRHWKQERKKYVMHRPGLPRPLQTITQNVVRCHHSLQYLQILMAVWCASFWNFEWREKLPPKSPPPPSLGSWTPVSKYNQWFILPRVIAIPYVSIACLIEMNGLKYYLSVKQHLVLVGKIARLDIFKPSVFALTEYFSVEIRKAFQHFLLRPRSP